ncbi:MAG: hypothetical protein E7448_07150 [Ruminococcaceae bacterium]|nr:hypothetical protein [Oscillospiraceae bacterium]
MKTIVINTSKEAQNTKLDTLFKAPFDHNSLLWFESELNELGGSAKLITESLLKQTDTVDRDYQLIVLVDLDAFPRSEYKEVVEIYRDLLERYICATLIERLYSEMNLPPRGVSLYFVDSAKAELELDLSLLAKNEQEAKMLEAEKAQKAQKQTRAATKRKNGDLSDDWEPEATVSVTRAPDRKQRILMEIFSWSENITQADFTWNMKISRSGNECLDFSGIFKTTADAIRVSAPDADVLSLALQEVTAAMETSSLACVGQIPCNNLSFFLSRENEQSWIEGFFCLFANIFSCVQEKKLCSQIKVFDKDTIRDYLIAALKKYKHFSQEKNIDIRFEPIEQIFAKRKTVYANRKQAVKEKTDYKDKNAEEVAELIMNDRSGVTPSEQPSEGEKHLHKLRGQDRTFYEVVEEIFGNYDPDVIRAQNNRIVKSCLEGLWNWRDHQSTEDFRRLVDNLPVAPSEEKNSQHRQGLSYIREEYEADRDELIERVTDAENKLSTNKNILLETRDLVLLYSDWMRKGKRYLISVIGAVFTVLATAFPYFYTEYNAVPGKLGVWLKVGIFVGFCAFLYAVAASVYMAYIKKQKQKLIIKINELLDKSKEERKNSIASLYRYYTDTVIEAESQSLLWQEILRRDRENAKKGIKRNYHIKRLKTLIELIERFITMLKIDVRASLAGSGDEADYAKMGLRLDGEESYFHKDNRRVYCFLPENEVNPKGGNEEA